MEFKDYLKAKEDANEEIHQRNIKLALKHFKNQLKNYEWISVSDKVTHEDSIRGLYCFTFNFETEECSALIDIQTTIRVARAGFITAMKCKDVMHINEVRIDSLLGDNLVDYLLVRMEVIGKHLLEKEL